MSKDTDPRVTGLAEGPLSRPDFDPRQIREDFPIFRNNPDVVFLDTAASAQKPQEVIDAVSNFYARDYANVHRGVYALSQRATDHYEAARLAAQRFLNARQSREIIFVRGATEGINLVAQSWGATFLKAGDEVLISELEHHSNIVPWQLLRDRIGVRLVVAPIDATGQAMLLENAEQGLQRLEGNVGRRGRLMCVGVCHFARPSIWYSRLRHNVSRISAK